jgi:hypothetical protein
MNKIVRKGYPAERLPADLHSEILGTERVNLEIEADSGPANARPVAHLIASGPNVHGEATAVVSQLRDLRDER